MKSLFVIIICIGIAGIGFWYFAGSPAHEGMSNSKKTDDCYPGVLSGGSTIEEVKTHYAKHWLLCDGIEGVGIGLCEDIPCIKVLLSEETPATDRIPNEVEGFKVEKEITGKFWAQ